MRSTTKALAVPICLTLLASALQAQGGCRIDEGRPGEVRDARNAILTRELAGSVEDKRTSFKRAVSLLTRPAERFRNNMIGRNLFLARALVNLALLPDTPAEVRRADAGFSDDPEGTVDLLAMADSLLDAVEAEQPACVSETEEIRRRPYAELINKAVNLYNERQIDSAEYYARRSLMIYGDNRLAYIAYNVLGNIQQSKDDIPGAIESFKKMAALMAGDTTSSVIEERKNTMILVAQLMTNAAEDLEGEQRVKAMREVVDYLEQVYLREFPGDVRAQSAIARAKSLSGDVEAAKQVFSDAINNPDKYTDIALLEMGVGAARAEMHAEAAALFEAGLKKNPYNRDGLFNLAATYDALGQYDKMPAILNRLLDIDPENPDNYRLWARYWRGRHEELRKTAQGKDASDPVFRELQAAIDSVTKYLSRFQDAPVKVSFTLFSHDGGRHVLGGNVENLTEQEKSYTLRFEFVDVNGNVLDTKEVAIENVPGKSSKSFRVEVTDKPGVVGFKYAPLTPRG